MWCAVPPVMCFTGLQSTLREGLRICWILSEKVCAQVGWPHKVGAQHRRRNAECLPRDTPLCGFHLVCAVLETLRWARLTTFFTFTIGFYLLLFMWGSESFPERTALTLASVWRRSARPGQGAALRPLDAASLHCTREWTPQAESRPPDHRLTVQPIRLT